MNSTPFVITPELAPAFSQFAQTLVDFLKYGGGLDPVIPDGDKDFRTSWQESLQTALQEDCHKIQSLLSNNDFGKKNLLLTTEDAESMIRICASIRLKIHSIHLIDLPDEDLESGNISFNTLSMQQKRAFSIYVFLANLQELLINHLE